MSALPHTRREVRFQSSRYLAELLRDVSGEQMDSERQSRDAFYLEVRRAVGERVREARERKGLSQRRLAELVGVREGSIGGWERGNTPWERISELARVLEVHPEWLYSGRDPLEAQVEALQEQVARIAALLEAQPPSVSDKETGS